MAYERVNWENLPSTKTPINADNLNKMDKGIANAVEKSDLLNLIYPVGSIYISVNSTNPANLFGGTWEQIKDRFLLACGSTYNAGATGGEATHRLTQNEIPNYSLGKIPAIVPSFHGRWDNGGVYGITVGGISSDKPGVTANGNERLSGNQYGWQVLTNGGGVAHNNMPPYLAVYMWKRIS